MMAVHTRSGVVSAPLGNSTMVFLALSLIDTHRGSSQNPESPAGAEPAHSGKAGRVGEPSREGSKRKGQEMPSNESPKVAEANAVPLKRKLPMKLDLSGF
jgi:hypothetical protein